MSQIGDQRLETKGGHGPKEPTQSLDILVRSQI
jgi:hypothetical protein